MEVLKPPFFDLCKMVLFGVMPDGSFRHADAGRQQGLFGSNYRQYDIFVTDTGQYKRI